MKGSSAEYYRNGIANFNSGVKEESVDEEFVISGEYVGVSSVLEMPLLDPLDTRGHLAEKISGGNPQELKGLPTVLKDVMKELPLELKAEPEENIYDDSYEKESSCDIELKKPMINCFLGSCCNRQFKDFHAFNQHKVQQHNIAEYKCSVCTNKLFSSLVEIEKHYLEAHRNDKLTSFECSNCKLDFGVQSSFLEHREKCCEAQTICNQILDPTVDFVSTEDEQLVESVRNNTQVELVKNSTIKKNADITLSSTALQAALGETGESSCHEDDYVSIKEVPCTALQDGILCQCSVCSRVVENTQPLKDVAKAKGNTHNKLLSCELCNSQFCYKSALDRHVKTHEPHESTKDFPCDICGSAFTRKITLKTHILLSHTSNPFKVTCSICNKVLVNKSTLKRHIRTVHLHVNKNTVFRCEYCGKTQSQVQSHRRHIHQVHLKDREFICAHCKRVYYDKNALVMHIQTSHLSDGKYKCEICGHVLNSQAGLTSHKNNKHSERAFNCEICGKIFKSKEKLQVHAAGHSDEKPFVCQTCGKGFKRFSNLQQHFYTHSDSRPHICSICGQSFRLRTHVKQHMAVHGLVKDHKCFVCNQMFARKRELNSHLAEHGV